MAGSVMKMMKPKMMGGFGSMGGQPGQNHQPPGHEQPQNPFHPRQGDVHRNDGPKNVIEGDFKREE